ncbi:MAG TPA: hypothetical protein VMI31_11775 [Fimbriimonadaceae bacterium]|nr:hypothetical protein [Fimbriimonadaceae bacterium]
MEVVAYGGWNRCARLVSGKLEMIVTLEVGPRVIRFAETGGPNMFVEYPEDMGKTGGDEYRSYGGHRLWIAPEAMPKTYYPDNNPVEVDAEGDWHVFTSPTESHLVQKQLRIKAERNGFEIEHRVYNRNAFAINLAPWALTVMAAGGECIFPQPKYGIHSENLLPVRPMVMWAYTNMTDPRWTWGRRAVRLKQTENHEPQKIGAFVKQGLAGYANFGNFYYKRFPCEPAPDYPDFGCNFETYTRHDMLEVESLGRLQTIEPDQYAVHVERHHLLTGVTLPKDDEGCGDFLDGLG